MSPTLMILLMDAVRSDRERRTRHDRLYRR
jgi:hypothetical protein